MKRIVACVLSAAIFAPAAQAATFSVATGVNTIIVYSNATEPEICTVRIPFSYLKDGKRLTGQQLCSHQKVAVGEKQEFCKAVDPGLVSVHIEGEPQANCSKSK